MKENEILTQVLEEFLKVTGSCDKAEKATHSFEDFYEFVENNENLKQEMYGFFYKLLDDYILFKFYTSPIPSLSTNKEYMDKYARDILLTAQTFFNFGGIKHENVQ